jgi:hypothetical protein
MTRKIDDQLIAAAQFGRTEEIQTCLSKGADVNAKDGNGYTALHWAALGQEKALALLLASGADVNARNVDGYTALHLAVRNGNNAVAEVIRRAGAQQSGPRR